MGGGGGAEGAVKAFIVDTGCQEPIIGTPVWERLCVADPRLVSAGSFLLVAPEALWGRDALKLTCDPVCSDAGLDVRRLKHLFDPRGVKRIFTFSDGTVWYCPLAVMCKLASPWLSPYLLVSLCGWAICSGDVCPDLPVTYLACGYNRRCHPDLPVELDGRGHSIIST